MIKTLKVGQTKKGSRVWLEGKALIENGFTHGTRYSINDESSTAVLFVNIEGKRKVAGTITRPIIDLLSKKNDIFTDTVQVTFNTNTIILCSRFKTFSILYAA